MKHVIAFTNGRDEIVSSLKLQVKFNMIALKDDGNKLWMDRQSNR